MLYVSLTGRLTKDAEMRQAAGQTVCGFSVASNEKIKGAEVVTFVDCSMWGKRGEAVSKYLTKGTAVSVHGKLSKREHDGKTYLRIDSVDQVELMGSRRNGGAESGSSSFDAPQEGDPDF